ncbi:hypothetical protein BT93_F1277 [Corymbia citriodora subsp. variegata]|nr:hypothetical protein BT93_F1277 [Corymbia citriodora subsp. variegata]
MISFDQSFELGFFSLGNSKSRYFGMWYKIYPKTTFWVANRDKPLTDSHGWDLRIGLERRLTSWKSMDDPSFGHYTYRLNINRLPQFEQVSLGSGKIFRTRPRYGIQSNGSSMASSAAIKPVFFRGENEMLFLYEARKTEFIMRVITNHYGLLQAYVASKRGNAWNIMYSLANDKCDSYGTSGANIIYRFKRDPICDCLKGFVPKSPDEWDFLNWSSGCTRRIPMNCSKEKGCFKLANVIVPNLLDFWLNNSMSLVECEAKCSKNCSCTAYANSLQFGSLLDVKEYKEDKYRQALYIRLPKSKLGTDLADLAFFSRHSYLLTCLFRNSTLEVCILSSQSSLS